MNMSWLSIIGGGITAAATLAVGISTSGILAANPTSEVSTLTAGETIYVEQPVIEVSASGLPYATTSIDPIVIAVLPASPATGTTPASTPVVTDPSVTPDPAMSAPHMRRAKSMLRMRKVNTSKNTKVLKKASMKTKVKANTKDLKKSNTKTTNPVKSKENDHG